MVGGVTSAVRRGRAKPGLSPGGRAFLPVILGADIGVYALARAFHEEYGAVSLVVSQVALGPVADSVAIENLEVGAGADDATLLAALEAVAQRFTGPAGPQLLLLANTDWLIRFLVSHRERLEQRFTVPSPGVDLLERLADKARFAELCTELDIPTPRTLVRDCGPGRGEPFDVTDLAFPVIAKAANSADYERLSFPGKRKVYQVESAEDLADLWRTLDLAGFDGRFVVQEMIPGDDTQMRSITCYVDQSGAISLICCAHVLLEEHTPSGLGNPAAMITMRDDELAAPALRLLLATGYRGFANFDVKVDPRDGAARYFEVNPRIGRNNYYVTAAGANPVRFLVADQVDGRRVEPVTVERSVLYSVVPVRMLRHYVLDVALRARVQRLIRQRATVNPLDYGAERAWRRRAYVAAAMVNQVRKFARHYPRVTSTGL